MNITSLLHAKEPRPNLRALTKAAFVIVIFLLSGFSTMTVDAATTKTTTPVHSGKAPIPRKRGVGRRGPVRIGKNGVRMVRGKKRVKVHGGWVIVEDWVPESDVPGPDDNPLGFFRLLGLAVVKGAADGAGMNVDGIPGMADLDDIEYGDDPSYVAAYEEFAKAHHIRRGPHGKYIMSPKLRAEFHRSPRFVAARAAARNNPARASKSSSTRKK
jgi:hypothetical protein